MRETIPIARNTGDTVRELLDDVNALLGYIAILNTPDVDAVRGSLDLSLRAARRKLLATGMYLAASGGVPPRARVPGVVPWAALTAAAAIAGLSAFLMVRSRA